MNAMRRYGWWLLVIVLVAGCVYLLLEDRRLQAHAKERECYMVSMQCVLYTAMHELEEVGDAGSYGVEKVFEMGMMDEAFKEPLARMFPEGFECRLSSAGYELREPGLRRVSLFRRDRLVVSDKEPARWERSGRRATK